MYGNEYDNTHSQNTADTIYNGTPPPPPPFILGTKPPPPPRRWPLLTAIILSVISLVAIGIIIGQGRAGTPVVIITTATPVSATSTAVIAPTGTATAIVVAVPTVPLVCNPPPVGTAKAPTAIQKFGVTLPTGSVAYSNLATDDTTVPGWATRIVHICWPSHTPADIQQALAFDNSWGPATISSHCIATTPCQQRERSLDNRGPVTLYASSTVTANELKLALVLPTATGSQSGVTTTSSISIDSFDTTVDFDLAALPVVTSINSTIITGSASAAAFATIQLGQTQQGCTVPALPGSSVNISTTPSLCASTQTGRFFKILFYYTGKNYDVSWVEWLTVFW